MDYIKTPIFHSVKGCKFDGITLIQRGPSFRQVVLPDPYSDVLFILQIVILLKMYKSNTIANSVVEIDNKCKLISLSESTIYFHAF